MKRPEGSLNEGEAAAYLDMWPNHLREIRLSGRGPATVDVPYEQGHSNQVFYWLHDLKSWKASREASRKAAERLRKKVENEAQKFVRRVLTKTFGGNPTEDQIQEVSKRVVIAVSWKPSEKRRRK